MVAPGSVAEKVGTVPEIALLKASSNTMLTVEVAVPLATTGPVPEMVEVDAAAPAMNVTVPPALETGVNRESVFTSALIDFNVHVELPEASDEEQIP